MAYDVFISYSQTDKQIANAVCAALENCRIRCWIAPRDMLPGTEYAEAIVNAIEECQVFVLVFSSVANDSPQVRREVERAVSKGKVILPFRIEEVIPTKAMEYCLSNTHWLDAMTPPLEAHLARMGETVNRLLGGGVSDAAPQAPRFPLPSAAVPPNGFEYRSEWALLGLPLVHVAIGLPKVSGIQQSARGIIAIGDSPRGVVAIGSFAVGGIALGNFSIGVFSVGFCALGCVSVGVVALGLMIGYGVLSMAPIAMGCLAVGSYAAGGYVWGHRVWILPVADSGMLGSVQFWLRGLGLKLHAVLILSCFVSYFGNGLLKVWGQRICRSRT